VNLGHFGGEEDHPDAQAGKNWPSQFAGIMGEKRGELLFSDLGYWDGLQCRRENQRCKAAKARLAATMKMKVGSGTASDRLMFGSDWLMLSKEKHWPGYARQLFKSIQGVNPSGVHAIFEGNARKLYTSL
jgi:hypothetical protein